MIKVLCFSTLFPSSVRPNHGIFVETRLRELLKTAAVDVRVVAPVAWFPSTAARFGDYAKMAKTPRRETRNGIEVLHPRYPLLPKIGMNLAPLGLALGAVPAIEQLLAEGFDFDVIDAHYYYPDGVAAAWLARRFQRPLMITARGTDLNLIPQHALPRKMMQWAAARADASIGVCAALTEVLRDWGVPGDKLHVFRNGVDLQRFRPMGREASRHQLGLEGPGPLLLSVGYLIERKGHHIAIEALAQLRQQQQPQARLVLVGEGPERASLQQLAQRLGLQDAVLFAGAHPNVELLHWYSAADAFVLASSREGWANVLLEAMACDTPVVATRIWGTPEVVTAASGGVLVEREAADMARGMAALLAAPPQPGAVRAYAEGFAWEPTSQAQLQLMRRLAAKRQSEPAHA